MGIRRTRTVGSLFSSSQFDRNRHFIWLKWPLLLLLLAPPAWSLTIKGVDIPDVLPARDSRPELVLNGAALRTQYLLVNTYIGQLYLEQPMQSAEAIFADAGHKRMVFHVLMKRISARRVANALYEALQLNITKEEQQALESEINTMISMFEGRMKAGDTGEIDYIPGLGTRVRISGKDKGIIPGKAFFNALLSVWIGENPINRTFKEGILGLEVSEPIEVAEQDQGA